MGCTGSTEVEPATELRRRKEGTDEFDGPVKSRSCTNVPYFILFVLFIIVWIVLVLYCVAHGDIRRILIGYDDCGNICGQKNPKLEDSSLGFDYCSGADFRSKPLMLIYPEKEWSIKKRECVANCSEKANYHQLWNRCIPDNEKNIAYNVISQAGIQGFFREAAEDLNLCSREIVYTCFLALGLSIIMIVLYRFFAGFLVWVVLIGVVIASVGVSAYLWFKWKQKHDDWKTPEIEERKSSTYFVYAVLSTLATIIILLLIFGMRKNIHLVAHLFKESGKAVESMPMLIVQPFLTFIAIVVLMFIWTYFFLWIESSGFARVKDHSTRITFKKDEVIQFARIYNAVAAFWMLQFLIGCQHMIIAGAVATWFFTRKKSQLNWPICKSYGYLFFYHLGTVAVGSLLIAIVQIIRVLFKLVASTVKNPQNDVTKALYKACSCCLYCLEKILVYLTRNAYIEVAIFGDGLWTSGKRAYRVLVNNALRVVAINSVGDFVLFLGKVLVVACAIFVGSKLLEGKEGLHYLAVPLTIIGAFAYFVAHAFMTAFEMIIDTIFICFCEDCDMNDGIDRPYYMSKGLMEFVERSQKVLRVGDEAAVPKSRTARYLSED